MSLRGTAQETLRICEEGGYEAPSGAWRTIEDELVAAVDRTRLYRPGDHPRLSLADGTSRARVRVDEGTTQAWARALVQDEGRRDLVLLNFASARNPGGGFLNGARSQEEDIARASALYPCLLGAPGYYEANRETRSLLYTDHVIYSPRVPFFRERNRRLLETPFLASVITAPAPNAGQVLRRDPTAGPEIEATLRRRAGQVLAVARDRGHRRVLLGAWGCGVFRNDPEVVADAFGAWLGREPFAEAFDEVRFAIYDPTRAQPNLGAFQRRFAPGFDGSSVS
ncbi:MAG: TIGR02452 family protein [Myxococcota bacterium]